MHVELLHKLATSDMIMAEAVVANGLFYTFNILKQLSVCKLQTIICFMNARSVKPAEIHHQLSEVYSENAVRDGMVRNRVRQSNKRV